VKTKLFLLLCLTLCSSIATADSGCPQGYYFTGRMIQGQGISYPECAPEQQQQQAQPEQSAAPRGHWETRWGAIALDPIKGKLAGVTNHPSKSSATKSAIKECYAQGGGKDCKLSLTYYNQCAANAWGESGYASAGRQTLEEAKRDALQDCGRATTDCALVYNACSNAQWISN
jgi:hypothetical protein